jgi:hypothetical protein
MSTGGGMSRGGESGKLPWERSPPELGIPV